MFGYGSWGYKMIYIGGNISLGPSGILWGVMARDDGDRCLRRFEGQRTSPPSIRLRDRLPLSRHRKNLETITNWMLVCGMGEGGQITGYICRSVQILCP